MAVEAPFSRFKKTNLKVYIGACIVLAIWFGYDGYFNEKFREKYTDSDGNPESTLVFNQKSPPVFFGAAAILGAYLFVLRRRKIIADENELVIDNRKKVPYESIQKIDKTHFGSKGFFIITYKNKQGGEVDHKLSNRKYDNLTALLEELVTKIS
jgi:hypothetical protein